jgi:hypothetical protein
MGSIIHTFSHRSNPLYGEFIDWLSELLAFKEQLCSMELDQATHPFVSGRCQAPTATETWAAVIELYSWLSSVFTGRCCYSSVIRPPFSSSFFLNYLVATVLSFRFNKQTPPLNRFSVVNSDLNLKTFDVYNCLLEPGSSVSIVPGYGLDDWAIQVRSPAGKGFFL